MSKCKYLLFSILTFGLFLTTTSAATCSYEERAQLNNEVSNITANYEVKIIELDPGTVDLPDAVLGTEEEDTYVATEEVFQVNILNITENVYAEVTNSYTGETVTYNYADTNNGNISIEWQTIGELTTYTIEIYSSATTGCEGTLLNTLRVSLPRYNDYSTYAICGKVPDYYLCQRYVFFDQVEFTEFSERVLDEIEKTEREETPKEDKAWYEAIFDFIKEHKVAFIAGGIVLVVVAGGIVVVVVRKRRRSEI